MQVSLIVRCNLNTGENDNESLAELEKYLSNNFKVVHTAPFVGDHSYGKSATLVILEK